MSTAKQDMKDFASFFTNAVSELEALEKRAAHAENDANRMREALRIGREQHKLYRERLRIAEQLLEGLGFRLTSRPVAR